MRTASEKSSSKDFRMWTLLQRLLPSIITGVITGLIAVWMLVGMFSHMDARPSFARVHRRSIRQVQEQSLDKIVENARGG